MPATPAESVEADTYQITVEPGITITAPRTNSRDIRRHEVQTRLMAMDPTPPTRPYRLSTASGARYERYRTVDAGLVSPAVQRPALAVVCTAGFAAAYNVDDEYGIDIDDLGNDHSLASEPTVTRLRTGAAVLGLDLWVAVRLPGAYEGADDAPKPDAAITRWTTSVLHPDELGWLRETLALNAADD